MTITSVDSNTGLLHVDRYKLIARIDYEMRQVFRSDTIQGREASKNVAEQILSQLSDQYKDRLEDPDVFKSVMSSFATREFEQT